MSAKILTKDRGWEALRRTLKALSASTPPQVQVGVLADAAGGASRGGTTLAEIAAVHEFGSADGRIPERSFLRTTLFEKQREYEVILRATLRDVLNDLESGRSSLRKGLDLLGKKAAADAKKKITVEGVSPPLAPSTVKRRLKRFKRDKGGRIRDNRGKWFSEKHGKHRPLVDTGQLVNAITSRVVLGAAPKAKKGGAP